MPFWLKLARQASRVVRAAMSPQGESDDVPCRGSGMSEPIDLNQRSALSAMALVQFEVDLQQLSLAFRILDRRLGLPVCRAH